MACLRFHRCQECGNEFFGSTKDKLCQRCYELIELRKDNKKLKIAKEVLKKMIKKVKDK